MTTYYAYLFPAPGEIKSYRPYNLPGYELHTFNLTMNGARCLACFQWTHTYESANQPGRTWTESLCFADYTQAPDTARVMIDSIERGAQITRDYRLGPDGTIIQMQRNIVPLDNEEPFRIGPAISFKPGLWRLGLAPKTLRPMWVPAARKLITGPENRR